MSAVIHAGVFIIYIKYISRKNLHKSQNAIILGVHDSHIFFMENQNTLNNVGIGKRH